MKNFSFLAIALCVALFMSCKSGNGSNASNESSNAQEQNVGQAATNNANAAQPAPTQDATQAAPQSDLPEAITSFVNSNFSGATITGSKRDSDDGEIEVYLSDGTEVEFAANNQWEKIKCPGKAVPLAVVPSAISSYVQANYQSAPITKIDKKLNGYEVELNNGVELNFDANGNFIGVDD